MNLSVILGMMIHSANNKGLKDICYPGMPTCFPMDERWFSLKRPIPPPQSPYELQIQAYFHNRDDPKREYLVNTFPLIQMKWIPFDPRKMTYFLHHGFENTGRDQWIRDLKDAILNRVDANVFTGDWTYGSTGVSYHQAVGNLRMASWQFARLVWYLQFYGLDLKKLHLIGHSLGAQICGQIGKMVPGILRITALDPSQPFFQGEDEEVRLVVGDARQVDVIHADARPFIPDLGFGSMEAIGDVDFWMNNGHHQPGCNFQKMGDPPKIRSTKDLAELPVRLVRQALICEHGMAQQFFIEAINNTDCIFWGRRSNVVTGLLGAANAASDALFSRYLAPREPCNFHTCSPVGLETFNFPARGSFVVTTRGFSPYCQYEPKIQTFEKQYQRINTLLKSFLAIVHSDGDDAEEESKKYDDEKDYDD